ncbi:hypothetical protein IPH25_00275 [bacterium]|nr:MAG: hypothetical protein IPG37_02390 [bacterium]QQR61869.1 MAG: hypothetical protein IPH25_00275 [bacterium]QQR62550.1 MAG: hypothetical protein IPH67_03965 [bacterium]
MILVLLTCKPVMPVGTGLLPNQNQNSYKVSDPVVRLALSFHRASYCIGCFILLCDNKLYRKPNVKLKEGETHALALMGNDFLKISEGFKKMWDRKDELSWDPLLAKSYEDELSIGHKKFNDICHHKNSCNYDDFKKCFHGLLPDEGVANFKKDHAQSSSAHQKP